MKQIITKEVKNYLNEYKPERFYSYALYKNIFDDDEVSYESFRKVLVRMEHDGKLISIGKGLYENPYGLDSQYIITEFTNTGRGVYVDVNDLFPDIKCTHNAIFTSIAGSNGLYLPNNTKVFQCNIEYDEMNKNLIKILYAYKRLDFILFVKNPSLILMFKENYVENVFKKITELLQFKDSSIKFLLKQLDKD